MIYLTVALFVAFLVSGTLAVDYRKKMIHQRERGNAWKICCSGRDQHTDRLIHGLNESNQVANAIIDGLKVKVHNMRRVCRMLGDARTDPTEIQQIKS